MDVVFSKVLKNDDKEYIAEIFHILFIRMTENDHLPFLKQKKTNLVLRTAIKRVINFFRMKQP